METTGAASGDALRYTGEWPVATLEWLPVEVSVDGEWLEDYWSPLYLALELGDAAAFRSLLTIYATAPVWSDKSGSRRLSDSCVVVRTSDESRDVITAFEPCLAAATRSDAIERFVVQGLADAQAEASGACVRATVDFSALATGAGGDEVEAFGRIIDLASRHGLGFALLTAEAPTLDANLGLLPTQVDMVVASAAMVGKPALEDHGDESAGPSPPFRASVGDAVAVAAAQHGVSAPFLTVSTPTFGYAVAKLSSDGGLAARNLVMALDTLVRLESGQRWFTAATPGTKAAAHENRMTTHHAVPATRADVLATLLGVSEDAAKSNAEPLPADVRAAWATAVHQMLEKSFGGNDAWRKPLCSEDDVADEDTFGLEESRAALADLFQALAKEKAVESNEGVDLSTLSVDDRFQRAVAGFAKVATKHPDAVKLEFYSLYKQATAGDVSGSRPWAIDFTNRAKYDAWAGRKGMPKEAAMARYAARFEELQS